MIQYKDVQKLNQNLRGKNENVDLEYIVHDAWKKCWRKLTRELQKVVYVERFPQTFSIFFCHLQYSQNIVEISILIVLDVSGILDYICVDYITI